VRVFVTGARGFVGTRLVARLTARGDAVVGADREVDVSRPEALRPALAGAAPDAVVHLAAVSFVPDSWSDPEATFRVNFLGCRTLLEAALTEAPRARVLLVSSGALYGSAPPGAPPFREEAPLRPDSPYAWTKAAADRLGGLYAGRGLDVVRARPFNHTGPGRPDRFVESSFARQIAELELGRRSGPLAVGNLDAVRDFLDVEDVVDAYLALLEPALPGPPGGVYNVASGRGRTARQLLDALLAKSPVTPAIVPDPARWRATDASVGDARRLGQATGWQPRRDFDDTLSRLLEHWRAALRAA
jgi:GDP-4-dehydro-6-deoxy-D-mannose reductase